ncbi:MAG: hypothetical protein V1827_00590 [Candidatus Micrarchaeota archaeon]
MEFKLLGRKTDVGLDHILLYIGAIFVLIIVSMLITLLAVRFDFAALPAYSAAFASVLGLIILPLIAWSLLTIAGFSKMKKDAALCRSFAAASFLFTLLLAIPLYLILGVVLGAQLDAADISISILSQLAVSAAGAISLYLWLLIFLAPERKRLADSAIYSFFFAVAMLIISRFIWVAAVGSVQTAVDLDLLARSFQFGSDTLFQVMRDILLAMPLLYFTLGKKLDRDAAYLFAALYLGAGLLALLSDYLSASTTWQADLASLITKAIALGLLYLLSRYAPPASNL